MQLDLRVNASQRRKLRLGLLDAVLAEHGLPGFEGGEHRLGGVCLGNRDQRDILGAAAGAGGGGGDPLADAR